LNELLVNVIIADCYRNAIAVTYVAVVTPLKTTFDVKFYIITTVFVVIDS